MVSDSLIIYHSPCIDGLGAAWVAERYIKSVGRKVETLAAAHGDEPPYEAIAGKDVYIVDFSYPREKISKILAVANSLTIIDHHITAQAELAEFSAHTIFDMNKSGAGLTWDYFYPYTPRPWLVDYVEDRDLWRHKLPKTEAVNAYISTLSHDFDTWETTLANQTMESASKLGEVVLSKVRRYVDDSKKFAQIVEFEGYKVPLVNMLPTSISEVVGELAEGHPFAMGWHQRADGKFIYSLRSRDGFDVSELAKRYGGGGHRTSSGFSLDYPFHLQQPRVSAWWYGVLSVVVTVSWLLAYFVVHHI